MGIRIEDIECIAGLDAQASRTLAQFLIAEAKGKGGALDDAALKAAVTSFVQSGAGWRLGFMERGPDEYELDPAIARAANTVTAALQASTWLEPHPNGLALTQAAWDANTAVDGTRMTRAEVLGQVGGIVTRLKDAPAEINGVRLNNLFLYGSALRDLNDKGDTMGDLDLIADVTLDTRHDELSARDKANVVRNAWGELISGGDDRLNFHAGVGLMARAHFNADPNAMDERMQPLVLMRLWRGPHTGSSLSQRELRAATIIEARTLNSNGCARDIRRLLNEGGASNTAPPPTRPPQLATTTAAHRRRPQGDA